jgi:hypothetical protein
MNQDALLARQLGVPALGHQGLNFKLTEKTAANKSAWVDASEV